METTGAGISGARRIKGAIGIMAGAAGDIGGNGGGEQISRLSGTFKKHTFRGPRHRWNQLEIQDDTKSLGDRRFVCVNWPLWRNQLPRKTDPLRVREEAAGVHHRRMRFVFRLLFNYGKKKGFPAS